MQIKRFNKATDFCECAWAFLISREAEHNLLLATCGQLAQHPGEIEPGRYLAVVEEGGALVAAAIMRETRTLVLSWVEDPAAVSLIALDLHAAGLSPPGVLGPAGTALAFAQEWQRLSGLPYSLQMAQRIYRLEKVKPVSGVLGNMRKAARADRDLLVDWVSAFDREALGSADTFGVGEMVDTWLDSGVREVYLWEHGRPVSLAASTGPTPNGIRIGPVYTPPEYRRRGYAGALVAALSQQLLDSGRTFCFLFTDLGNPTSNHVYQDIGYNPVSDAGLYQIGP
jgi:predicted GNAT family acetyltransferase